MIDAEKEFRKGACKDWVADFNSKVIKHITSVGIIHCGGSGMKINEYQLEAYKTAIYTDKVIYPTLGLINEIGEISEKYVDPDKYKIDEVLYEVGDVMWYIAALCTDLGLNMSSLEGDDFCELDSMYFEASVIAGIIKKWLRDSNRTFSVEKIFELQTHLSRIFIALRTYCLDISFPLEDIFRMNIEKLNSRKERGVITGSGDHR